MNDTITNHGFAKECDELANDIFEEIMADAAEDETPEHHEDAMRDRAHETADGHQWVIYHHYARTICATVDVSQGEEFLQDVGMPNEVTFDKLATTIAYGEMRARIEQEIARLSDEWEPAEDAA